MILKIVSGSILKISIPLFLCACNHISLQTENNIFPKPLIKFEPKKYVVYKTNQPLYIDGKLADRAWEKAEWTDYFVNITGNSTEAEKKTRAKILWDDKYLYIGAELKEKNIWGTMEKRNSPLYLDNAFEVFIDPDGDTHNYLEFEINALSTIWDLFLTRPHRDGGYSISNYNMLNVKYAVITHGTVNDPQTEDHKWTLEVAFPMEAIKELKPKSQTTRNGDQWRVQFARAQRHLEVIDGTYKLKTKSGTNEPLSPTYTSWTPQGLVNLHYPEMWGYIQFSDDTTSEGDIEFNWKRQEEIKWALRKVYYGLKEYKMKHNSYTDDISDLELEKIYIEGFTFNPQIQATKSMFEVTSKGFEKDRSWVINNHGRIWSR